MTAKPYYAITTKKFILKSRHKEWLMNTRDLYNELLGFYYDLFLNHPDLYELNNQQALRELEKITVIGRDKQPVQEELPWKKVPLYFRRAAINTALAAGRSFLSRKGRGQNYPTEKFSAGVTLYKGMYKMFDGHSISLKVWTGEKWQWIQCLLYGNEIPPNTRCMSPILVFRGKNVFLHVPVSNDVPDGRTLKERCNSELKICGVRFTDRDALAACCILNPDRQMEAVRFINGGNAYRHYCAQVDKHLEKAEASMEKVQTAGKKYVDKLENLSTYHSHMVSRRIVDFCVEKGAGIIVIPKFSENEMAYPLSQRIRNQLKYKAWQMGILLLEADTSGTEGICAVCGKPIERNGEQFVCEEGHQGNWHLNASRNMVKKCLENLDKHMH